MRSAAYEDAKPLMEMNTTPLIDVMLVLLVMFIVTIPIQTHAVKLDLPAPGPVMAAPDPIRNVVIVTAGGQLLWNGDPVEMAQLERNLAATAQMNPQPELHLRPDATARYEQVDQVLALARGAEVNRLGFVGNEAFARF